MECGAALGTAAFDTAAFGPLDDRLRDVMGLSTTMGVRSAKPPRARRSRIDRVLAGLGSAAIFFAGPTRLPAIKQRGGIAADWRAVGDDLAAAMKHRER
ncbi:MAG: hypothetical protein B7X49_05970 [Acidiphilium sp. 34-64-41]|nr:MAG: hypothetical protein B7X49_05970 [Acidiphilium sp. 34-64-41]